MTYPPPPGPPPYPAAPPPSEAGKPKLRGRIPLRLSLIFGVVGVALVVVAVIVLVNSPLAKIDDFARAKIDGQQHSVNLTRTGSYVGYYEEPGLNTSSADSPAFRIAIADASGGPVTISRYSASTTLSYNNGGHHGIAVAKFKIKKPGTYTVRAEGAGVPGDADVAFGESIANALIAGVLLIIPGALLVVAAIVLLIVGIVRRRGHRRQLAAYGGYPPGGYPPGGYPPGGPPPAYPGGSPTQPAR